MAKRKSAAKKATRKSMKKAAAPATAKGRGKVTAAGKRTAKAAKKTAKKAAKAKAAKAPQKAAKKAAAKAVKAPARKMTMGKAAKAPAPVARPVAKVAAKKAMAPKKAVAKKRAAKKAPGTDQPSIPSSLNMDQRSSSSARSGRQGMSEQLKSHNESSPALTGGDVDANWEGAYSSGDEAPGGDNPTPDQDVVDDIGHALGVEYNDDEELKGADKITDRDKHRWELNPASSEDYRERK
jgi:hypothetical protein